MSSEVVESKSDTDSALPSRSVKRMTPGRLAFRRFMSNRLAVIGSVVLLVLVIASVFAPLLVPYPPNQVDLSQFRLPPSSDHWLGTDGAGRDVLSRLLFAGRVSLTVGLAAALTAALVGLVLGAIAGMIGGWVDGAIMRLADTVLSFPSLIIVIVFAGILGPSLRTIVLAIGLFEWPTACRVVRGLTLSLREQEFIEAARAIGSRESRLIVRHIVPAVLAPLSVVATLLVAQAVLVEAALSFLGLGVQPPLASWGNMLNGAQSLTLLREMPWLWVPPGVAVAVTVLAVNFVGDGLRDAVDPNQT